MIYVYNFFSFPFSEIFFFSLQSHHGTEYRIMKTVEELSLADKQSRWLRYRSPDKHG